MVQKWKKFIDSESQFFEAFPFFHFLWYQTRFLRNTLSNVVIFGKPFLKKFLAFNYNGTQSIVKKRFLGCTKEHSVFILCPMVVPDNHEKEPLLHFLAAVLHDNGLCGRSPGQKDWSVLSSWRTLRPRGRRHYYV